jgi:hypothetical protein
LLFLVGLPLLGCAHKPATASTALSVDDKTAIQVEAFRTAILFRGDPSHVIGDMAGVTGQQHIQMCLGIHGDAKHLGQVDDVSPRVVQTLERQGALVAPVSQCRNPGVQPPLLDDGSRVRIGAVLLHPFNSVRQGDVTVELERGCFRSLGSTCTGYQHLVLTIKKTATGWVTRGVAEGFGVD